MPTPDPQPLLSTPHDRYVKLSLRGQSDARSRGQTDAVASGGTDVVFTDAHHRSHTLAFTGVARGAPLMLVVEAMDKDAGTRDDVIGVGEVDVTRYALSPRGVGDEVCRLKDGKGAPSGLVVLHFGPAAAAPTTAAPATASPRGGASAGAGAGAGAGASTTAAGAAAAGSGPTGGERSPRTTAASVGAAGTVAGAGAGAGAGTTGAGKGVGEDEGGPGGALAGRSPPPSKASAGAGPGGPGEGSTASAGGVVSWEGAPEVKGLTTANCVVVKVMGLQVRTWGGGLVTHFASVRAGWG
jgi:hypothetical protein